MAVRKRTTKPISDELKALRAQLRAAEARGENPVRPLYQALDRDEKRVFIGAHRA